MNFRKIIIGLFFLIMLVNSWCTKQEKEVKKDENKTYAQVEVMEIWNYEAKEFSVMWEVFPEKESILRSKSTSDVVEVYVKEWDKINKWQILAVLKSDQIEQNYQNALNSYNSTVSSANRSINSAQVAVNNAQSSLGNTLKTSWAQKSEAAQSLSQTKTSTELSIAQSEQNLDNAILNSERSEETARTNLSNALISAKITAKDSLNEIDKILWIEEFNEDSALKYDDYLWNLDPSTLTDAESAYRKAKVMLDSTDFSDPDAIIETLKVIKSSALYNVRLLENSWSWPSFTSTELQNLIQSTNLLANSIQSSINSVSSSKNALDSTLTWNKSSIESAQRALELARMENWGWSQVITSAEKSYERNIASIDSSVEAAKNQVSSAEASLASARSNASLSISNAKSALDSAKVALDDLTIRAPFSWEVSNVYVEKWNEVSAWSSIVSIWDSTKFKIVSYLTKKQIKWLKKWDEVKIWTKSMDLIHSISQIADASSRKHKLEIIHQNPFLKSWEFIKLRFTPKQEIIWDDNEIYLPMPAVFVTSEWNYVWSLDGLKSWNWNKNNNSGTGSKINKIKKVNVELWEISWNMIEIKDWLVMWDEVIIEGGRFLKEGASVEVLN